MRGAAAPTGGGPATALVLGFAVGALGLFGGLPFFVGPAVGGLGVGLSAVWRARRTTPQSLWPLAPALLALAALAVTAPADPATELFAGLSGLAFLLWLADDPAQPVGGGRRAVPTIAPAALGVGLAWAITVGLAGLPADVGLAGGLVAAALVLLAFLVAGLSRRPAVARNA